MNNTNLLTQVIGSGPVRRLEIKITINAQIQRMWEAITDTEKMQHWWTGGTVELREGGHFILEDGAEVNGTVKLCHPPYIFAFSWNDTPEKSGHPHLIDVHTKSTVRFDLAELPDDRTALSFIQYLPPGEVVAHQQGGTSSLESGYHATLKLGKYPKRRIGSLN